MHTVYRHVAQRSPALSVKPHLALAQLQPLHKAYHLLCRILLVLTQKVATDILHTPQQRQHSIANALSRVGMSATLVAYALKLLYYNILVFCHIIL